MISFRKYRNTKGLEPHATIPDYAIGCSACVWVDTTGYTEIEYFEGMQWLWSKTVLNANRLGEVERYRTIVQLAVADEAISPRRGEDMCHALRRVERSIKESTINVPACITLLHQVRTGLLSAGYTLSDFFGETK